MDLNFIQIILVIIVAFLAGVEGILDQFHFHQPVIACTLIGLVTGNLIPCLILGGTLQMIALGWANIGAAVAPDAALASVASAIILVLGGQGEVSIISNRNRCTFSCSRSFINNYRTYISNCLRTFNGCSSC